MLCSGKQTRPRGQTARLFVASASKENTRIPVQLLDFTESNGREAASALTCERGLITP
jgi:hypothetical protein